MTTTTATAPAQTNRKAVVIGVVLALALLAVALWTNSHGAARVLIDAATSSTPSESDTKELVTTIIKYWMGFR